ncbi:NCS2 family permease [Cumulibacter soli]|uniref:NCS2 family permease n=1 Tax=Cumulibacter soli TaxID=2546344 RepID=UPI00106791CC|nr:NCS2 family permease [Cumulibacter soli]
MSERVTGSETAEVAGGKPRNGLDRYFEITKRGSTLGREVRGGLTTFFTMAYIIVLNPIILAGIADVTGQELPFAAVASTTALVAAVMTILMGVVGKFPLALAAGLGINAQVAALAQFQLPWQQIMGLVVLEGILITLLVVTGFRTAVFNAIPHQLKIAISVGIGLFLTFIGLKDAGFTQAHETGAPVLMGQFGELKGWPVLVFVVGVLLMAVLYAKKVRGSILIAIVVTTVLAIVVEKIAKVGPVVGADGVVNPTGWRLNTPAVPSEVVALPDLSIMGDVDLFGAFEASAIGALLIIFTLMLADFFDTMGTTVAVASEGKMLKDDGTVENIDRILLVDSLAAVAGGASSVSSSTTFIESSAGVAEGARTGFASVITGLMFVVAMFFAPIVNIVPSEAAAPALIIVGALMIMQVKELDLHNFTDVMPIFLTIALMPFTYSITNGIGAGFIAWVLLRVVTKRAREIHWLMWVITALFVIYFAIDPIRQLIG